MPTATLVGFVSGVGGDWPAGKGSAGYEMLDSSAAVVASLPASVTSITYNGPSARTDLPIDSGGTGNGARLPGGGARSTGSWTSSADLTITLANSSPILVTQYFRALGAPTGQDFVRLRLLSADKATTYLDVAPAGAALNAGSWVTYLLQGPGSVLTYAEGYQRTQVFLFDFPPTAAGRLLCFEAGRSGLIA